ncbi:hypothetical protein RvY_09537 [Ramazzottius varieornatus]|uniref:Cap-specific mRNA (nucleoside-2'-O-)-methyltransferase 2 n=1 Tax=Ramazzottius varieornatus TaxID=947166 RepID=A0A1D1VE83_RAMVA|nr:hypothetical protein RvY_09537 [Ramazzottius varieornatus]
MDIMEQELISEKIADSAANAPGRRRKKAHQRGRHGSPRKRHGTPDRIRHPLCPQFWSGESKSKLVTAALNKQIEDLDGRLYTLSDASHSFVSDISSANIDVSSGCREPYASSEMELVETELNAVKARVGGMPPEDWYRLTNYTDLASALRYSTKNDPNVELGTNAWLKFWSILHDFSQLADVPHGGSTSVHLCEAPGAFVSALNHFLAVRKPTVHQEWSWLGSSLNPYASDSKEAIADDRLIKHTLKNWHFGADNIGDLRLPENQLSLVKAARSHGKKVLLVTADGGIDCSDNPADQELSLSELKLAEVRTTLSLLDLGGNFVIKMFTFFRKKTCQLVQVLRICFSKVVFYKPSTSKPGNSEIYVICLGFKGLPAGTTFEFLIKKELEPALASELTSLAHKCADHQSVAIRMNLAVFTVDSTQRPRRSFHQAKQRFSHRFLTYRPIFALPNSARLIPMTE